MPMVDPGMFLFDWEDPLGTFSENAKEVRRKVWSERDADRYIAKKAAEAAAKLRPPPVEETDEAEDGEYTSHAHVGHAEGLY